MARKRCVGTYQQSLIFIDIKSRYYILCPVCGKKQWLKGNLDLSGNMLLKAGLRPHVDITRPIQ